MEKYFTTKQVAEMLGFTVGTIRVFCKSRRLGYEKIGGQFRISEKHIQDFFNRKGKPKRYTQKELKKEIEESKKRLRDETF